MIVNAFVDCHYKFCRRLIAEIKNKRFYGASSRLGAKILACDPIEPVCGKVFRDHGHELVEIPGLKKDGLLKIIADYDGVVVRSGTTMTKELIDAGTKLKIIGRAGTGVDNIDVQSATSRGILVVNTPGGNTVSTAELAMSHILALARNIPQANASLKAGRWDRALYTGTELSGKVLGVIGVGKIGREVAKWCRGFGMTTVGYDPVLSEQSARNFGVDPVSLDELFKTADFITIHTPLTKETTNLFNSTTLAKCKKGVRIINCARGGIVNEEALLAAVKSGHVAGAALDVLEQEPPVEASKELRMHPNIVITPHLGASTTDAQERVARAIAQNMSDILDGGAFVGVVNSPDLGAVAKQKELVPFVSLAERIGSIQGQLLKNNKIGSITINLRGKDISDSRLTDVIKSAVIKGALTELGTQLSYVSALSVAEEMGLKVLVNMSEKTETGSGYINSLGVELEFDGVFNYTRVIEGTVFGSNELRITKIDGYSVDLPHGENILMWNNFDRPGVLKKVMDRLAEANINIAHFSMGRQSKGSKAMGAVVLDTPAPEEVVTGLGKYADISNVVQVCHPLSFLSAV